MSGTSEKSIRQTSPDLSRCTYSQALADGLTHSGWLVGQTDDPLGQEAALASHLVSPERAKELTTLVTSGPLFAGSSPDAGPQLSSENRLRRLMGADGSAEYELTWTRWDIGVLPQICALRASALRTSGKGSGGWPTPNCPSSLPEGHSGTPGANKKIADLAAGWPTPRTPTGGPESAERKRELGRAQSGGGDLQATAMQIDGWPKTPQASDGEGGVMEIRPETTGKYKLRDWAMLAGWATPSGEGSAGEISDDLEWRGRKLVNKRTGRVLQTNLGTDVLHLTGPKADGTPAATANPEGFRLNHRFSLWLLGFPVEWACCGERATPSARKSRPAL